MAPKALTANRNNDRWPVLVPGPYVLFSLWSRNREAVTPDGAVAPWAPGRTYLTRPTDVWLGAREQPSGGGVLFAACRDLRHPCCRGR